MSSPSKAERAAAMRAAGADNAEVARAFGWSAKTTREMVWRGRNISKFREQHREFQRRRAQEVRA